MTNQSIFKPSPHYQGPMKKPIDWISDTFSKEEFESDLGEYIQRLIKEYPYLDFVRNESPELPQTVEQISIKSIRKNTYQTLADLLDINPNDIPERIRYHFGTFINNFGSTLVNCLFLALIDNPIVKRDLTWHGQKDLEVNCDTISRIITNQYCAHLQNREYLKTK